MIAFIDDHRGLHGVEPICKVLPIAPSTYYAHVTKRDDPEKLSARARRDMALEPEIVRVFKANFEVYGVKKIWHQMVRERFDIARCTVASHAPRHTRQQPPQQPRQLPARLKFKNSPRTHLFLPKPIDHNRHFVPQVLPAFRETVRQFAAHAKQFPL